MPQSIQSILTDAARSAVHQLLSSPVDWPQRFVWDQSPRLVVRGNALENIELPVPHSPNDLWLESCEALLKFETKLAGWLSEQRLGSLNDCLQFCERLIRHALLTVALESLHRHNPVALFASLTSRNLEQKFNGILETLCRDVEAGQIQFRFCRRLQGVQLDVEQLDFPATHFADVAEELEGRSTAALRNLSDEECTLRLPTAEMLALGLFSSDHAPLHRVEMQIARSEPLVHCSQYFKGPSRQAPFFRDSERVQEALLLWNCESQVELGAGHFETDVLGRCGRRKSAQHSALQPPIRIQANDGPALAQWLHVTNEIQKHANLRAALHRYVLACGRLRPEDALVDLVIGLESILLSGLQNELSHRFSLNGSSLCHWILGTPRRDGYQLLRQAYAARSSIVHGYGRKLKAHRMETLSNEIRVLLSKILGWLIQDAAKYGLPVRFEADDWLRVLFEGP